MKILSSYNYNSLFYDPLSLSMADRFEGGEQRWQTFGLVGGTVVLLVAHTFREENGEEVIRIISARKAKKQECKHYAEG